MAIFDLIEFSSSKRSIEQTGSINLAAKHLRDEFAAHLTGVARAGHQERRLRQILLPETKDLRNMRTALKRSDLAQQTVIPIADTLLIQGSATGLGVEAGRHEVPHLRLKLFI